MELLLVQVITLIITPLTYGKSVDDSNYHGIQEMDHYKQPIIPIIKHNFKQYHGGYQYSYETGNGIYAQETGYIKHQGDEKHETLVQQGKITYHDEHGHPITLTYIADENGFQPQGEHLPTAPPIPEEIRKALNSQQQQHVEQKEDHVHQEHNVKYEQQPELHRQQEQEQEHRNY